MPKRKETQNHQEVPSKSIKLAESQLEQEPQSSMSIVSETSQVSKQTEEIKTPELQSTSRVNDSKEDRYTLNYWGHSSCEGENVKEANYVKIGNLSLGI